MTAERLPGSKPVYPGAFTDTRDNVLMSGLNPKRPQRLTPKRSASTIFVAAATKIAGDRRLGGSRFCSAPLSPTTSDTTFTVPSQSRQNRTTPMVTKVDGSVKISPKSVQPQSDNPARCQFGAQQSSFDTNLNTKINGLYRHIPPQNNTLSANWPFVRHQVIQNPFIIINPLNSTPRNRQRNRPQIMQSRIPENNLKRIGVFTVLIHVPLKKAR